MALMLDGNSEIVANVRNNISFAICLRHSIRSKAVTNCVFFSLRRPIFLHACATGSELPSMISTFLVLVDTFKTDSLGSHNLMLRKPF